MNKYMYKRLMFPEPADNGGGGGAATPPATPPADNGGGGGRGNNYSLTDNGGGGATPPPAAPPAEYALSFEDGDGINDAFREMYTSAAKAAALPADAASKFVHDMTVRSVEYQQRAFADAEAALQKEWGRDFQTRLQQTADFATRLCNTAGISNEERTMFENPVAMRLFDALRRSTTEGNPAGMGQTSPAAPAKSAEEQIWEISRMIAEENHKPDSDFMKIQSWQKQINKLAGLD